MKKCNLIFFIIIVIGVFLGYRAFISKSHNVEPVIDKDTLESETTITDTTKDNNSKVSGAKYNATTVPSDNAHLANNSQNTEALPLTTQGAGKTTPQDFDTSEFDEELANLVLSEYENVHNEKADISSLNAYHLVLSPKAKWLEEYEISGEELSELAFSRARKKMKDCKEKYDDMKLLWAQGICISEVVNHIDEALLKAFYSSVNIPSVDTSKFSKSVKAVTADTYAIYITANGNLHKFYVPSFTYEKHPDATINNFANQVSIAIRVGAAKEYLINRLSQEEAKELKSKVSFDKDDLLKVLRSQYDITLYVPDYKPIEMLGKAHRLLKNKNIALRPNWQH